VSSARSCEKRRLGDRVDPVPEAVIDIQEQVDRLEALRQKFEACESLEEAVDLLGEFDAAAKELIESIDRAKRESDAHA
jgi:hypothetical protein